MTDLLKSTTSAFSDRPAQPSTQSCRLALHRGSGGLSAAALAHSTLEPVAGGILPKVFTSYRTGRGAGASTVYVIMCEVFK